jgi:hypothetical protein
MSAGGRIVLLILGLSLAAYMTSSETGPDLTGPLNQTPQESQAFDPKSPAKSELGRSQEPSLSLMEPTVVTIVNRPVEHLIALSQSRGPRSGDAIARELQKELKRVGCYAGEFSGVWTTSTRLAMKAFTDRVNARLPVDKPDNILLALVRGYPNKACGIPCPSGQSPSRTLECTPNALLAQTRGTSFAAVGGQRLAHVTSAWTVKTTAADGLPSSAETEHRGDAAPVEPTSSSAGPPLQKPTPRRAKRWQPPTSHERSWASNFFRQRDRLSLN